MKIHELRSNIGIRFTRNVITQSNIVFNYLVICKINDTETTESSAAVADEKDLMDPMYRLEKLRALEAQSRMTSSQPNPP